MIRRLAKYRFGPARQYKSYIAMTLMTRGFAGD